MKKIKEALLGLGKLISKGPTTPRPIGQVEITLHGGERRSFEGKLLEITQPYKVGRINRSFTWAVDFVVLIEDEVSNIRVHTCTTIGRSTVRVHHSIRNVLQGERRFTGVWVRRKDAPTIKGYVKLFDEEAYPKAA